MWVPGISTTTVRTGNIFSQGRTGSSMTARERTYLDHNATSPLRPEVAAAIARALTSLPGNPSSVHAEGRAARAAVERAREQVANLVGAAPGQVAFTSGGTEAANAVLTPAFRRARAPAPVRLLAGATEHVCVLDGHGFGAAVDRIPVDGDGLVDLAWLEDRLAAFDGDTLLVSIQTANNETGVVQPVAAAADLARARGALLHSDAVQAGGRIALDLGALGADALTLSAHKLGGPKGVGAVVLASDGLELPGSVRGGGQERGRRGGTENVAAIIGFGVAAEIAGRGLQAGTERLLRLRRACEEAVRRAAPEAVIFAERRERLPNTVAFAVPGLRAETALIGLDLAGVAVSSGSACSSGKVRRSHVLEAMGVRRGLAEGAIRVSLGWNSTQADVSRFAAAFEKLVKALYRRGADAA